MFEKVATHWVWELTPKEVLAGFYFANETRSSVAAPMGLVPFKNVKRRPLPGTPYEYQIALGHSVNADVKAYRKAHPELATSEHRSGVLVFDADKIIGYLLMNPESCSIYVSPKYRKSGIALNLIVEWNYQIKRSLSVLPQPTTLAAAMALLHAHKLCVQRAVAEGKEVPAHVLSIVEDGTQAKEIIMNAGRKVRSALVA